MFNKYINYDKIVEEMIREHTDNLAALESLRQRYEELEQSEGLKALRYDGVSVKTSGVSDKVVDLAIQREALQTQIRDLEMERQLFQQAWNRLSDDERRVLETFFMQDLSSEDAAAILMEHLCCERATIFRKRKDCLKRFKRLMFGN